MTGRHTRRAQRAQRRRERAYAWYWIGVALGRSGLQIPAGARMRRGERAAFRRGYADARRGA